MSDQQAGVMHLLTSPSLTRCGMWGWEKRGLRATWNPDDVTCMKCAAYLERVRKAALLALGTPPPPSGELGR